MKATSTCADVGSGGLINWTAATRESLPAFDLSKSLDHYIDIPRDPAVRFRQGLAIGSY